MTAHGNHRTFPRPLMAVAIIALACIVTVVIADAYSGGNGSGTGFQEYKPAGLPAGLTVRSVDLNVQRYPGLWPSFNRFINLNLSRPNSWITENKSDGQAFYDGWCRNYGQKDCGQHRTPGGQDYLLTKAVSSTSETVQEAYFIKGGTSIDVNIRGYADIPVKEWSDMVDSFQPAHYDHPTIIRGSTRGP